MKTITTVILSFFSIIGFSQQQTFSGIVLDDCNKKPLSGLEIFVYSESQQLKSKTKTDSLGFFIVSAKPGDKITLHSDVYDSEYYTLNDTTSTQIVLLAKLKLMEIVTVGYAGSSASSWAGALLAYNLDGKSSENIIGSSKVRLNTAKKSYKWFMLNIVGNIAKFTGTIDTAAVKKDIREIVQSTQGLSIGLEPLFLIKNDDKNDLYIRAWISPNYKVNQFNDVEIGNSKENITLSQFRLCAGAEVEAIKFIDGDKLMHFGIEGAISYFNAEKYMQLFNENRNKLFSLEWNIIVPLFGTVGFIAGQTISNGTKPVFWTGIVFSK
jgi:hypothetical protein